MIYEAPYVSSSRTTPTFVFDVKKVPIRQPIDRGQCICRGVDAGFIIYELIGYSINELIPFSPLSPFCIVSLQLWIFPSSVCVFLWNHWKYTWNSNQNAGVSLLPTGQPPRYGALQPVIHEEALICIHPFVHHHPQEEELVLDLVAVLAFVLYSTGLSVITPKWRSWCGSVVLLAKL